MSNKKFTIEPNIEKIKSEKTVNETQVEETKVESEEYVDELSVSDEYVEDNSIESESNVEESTDEDKIIESEKSEDEHENEISKSEPMYTPIFGIVRLSGQYKFLNIRQEPRKDSLVIGKVSIDERVRIDKGRSTDLFYRIHTYDGIDGFCLKEFIEIER